MDIGIDRGTITLDSRFVDVDQPVLLTGIQSLMRLLLEQRRLDSVAGLNTAGFVSGYRGSPLGGLDRELWVKKKLMAAHDIKFEPGVNEDLAATMVFGTQELGGFPGPKYDGVFGMWYGKGPGVDRSGDAFKCANMIGTHRNGGVLAVSGDDHGAHSSTYPHQTELVFQNCFIPVINPASVQDVIDLGLAGYALSRFAGVWVAMKTTAETMEQASTAIVRSEHHFLKPDIALPPHGLNIDHALRFPADRAELERRMLDERLPAVLAWARANRIDRVVSGGSDAAFGLITVGKAHDDTLHALRRMGLDRDPRLAIYKVGMTWPLEPDGIRDFARGKRALLVIEEKLGFVESQIRDILYHVPADQRPEVSGKTMPNGQKLLSPLMELSPESVAGGMAAFLGAAGLNLPAPPAPIAVSRPDGLLRRIPAFCAGCPHQTSTKLPDGSFASAGIGCHFMAMDNDPHTRTFTHMGGEGAPFAGLQSFTEVKHFFANLGDGTYQHSGSLAIRQAVAAKARITYKLLFNDAVAMTGGQPAEGAPTVPRIAHQVAAEGINRIAIVADEADRLPKQSELPAGTTLHTRESLDEVQRALRDYEGPSVLIYDQVCATEKRRRRKRGSMEQPVRHVVINESVCENCGDCSTQSGCIAIEPVETELGRKRRINQTSCNVDLSCLKGFCPSFVTVDGPPSAPDADAHWQGREQELAATLKDPVLPDVPVWRALFAGIGGGGIVTAGAVLAMAAHLEGKAVKTLDFTGLAQKNGAVVAHVQIAGDEAALDVVRIPLAAADLMLAADLAVGCQPGVLERNAKTGVVIGNLDLAATAEFKRNATLSIDALLHKRTIEKVTDASRSVWLHGVRLAERLFGNAQAMNTMLLGLAWQRGLIPVGQDAIQRAIELNGAAVPLNRRAFLWGRILAEQPALAEQILTGVIDGPPKDLDTLIAQRMEMLTAYQSGRYARRYKAMIDKVSAREAAVSGIPGPVTRAAAEGLFRVMAYKDEYEVARLHAEASYGKDPVFHLSPPLGQGIDKATGRRRKIAIKGGIALPLFRILRHGKALRGTPLDVFGYQAERRQERGLVRQYQEDLKAILDRLRPDNIQAAVALAELPGEIRGFGPVKDANRAKADARRTALRAALSETVALPMAAE
ncbi:MAG TPA: indolepyruvate ferredoxin oxidoreductase family protein [Rhodopila sp.]|uniref:indolepyruvate ferredoxin oxidoreductase family protein n=1 Tax=Rhodopila sp. TaxID=2480087 RepID=UPI002B671E54|nr:indolepyruvate ferredoxin oxidoreductase family protein [Rhodopila sp.]HVY14644.1 indolepyruvate ferredoxin oxidoreductase family protein [Rhodopila sp.]